MAREVDERKKRAALRKLRRAADLAEKGLGPPLSEWEARFLAELEARIETYGSAFADPSKGDRGEALSSLQRQKLTEIDRKSRGKARLGMSRKAMKKPPGPREEEDLPHAEAETAPSTPPAALAAIDGAAPRGNVTRLKRARPALRVIEGGRGKKDES